MDHRHRRRAAAVLAVCLMAPPLTALTHTAAAETTEPTWLVGWELNRPHDIEELSREYDRDGDGDIDSSWGLAPLPDVLNPEQFTLHVSACAAPEGFTSIDWQLARPGEDPLPAVTVTECETDLVLPDKPYPEARDYDLTATVHYPETPDQTSSAHVRVQDIFMVGLGDSYGSGEGNPLSSWNEDLDIPFAEWDDFRCHRSRLSGQEQAAHMLDQLPGLTVTFLHLACSGALASTGILQPYEGLNAREPKLPPQVSQAAEYIERSQRDGGSKRFPDLVVTSIGGNDAGFADVVVGCLSKPDYIIVPVPFFPFAVPIDFDSCYEPGEAADQYFEPGLASLPDLYAQIDAVVDGRSQTLPALCDPARGCTFMITEYPDASTDENGDPCEYYAPGFTEDEFAWVINSMVPRLNGAIRDAAEAHGWVYVDGVRTNFEGHGICAEDDYMRDILESFEIQYDKNGAFHPDAAGHLYGYADAIVDKARQVLGVPYRDTGYTGPLYAGTGQPPTCDTTTGDGKNEQFVDAPAADLTGLVIAPDIAAQLAGGQLPRAVSSANSCANRANVQEPYGVAPIEMRAGRPGCPDDPRPCRGGTGSSSLVRLPKWGDEAPMIDVRAEADSSVKAGDQLDLGGDVERWYRRASDAEATGSVPFLAAAINGATTVTGEIVVDLTARAQATGASGEGQALFDMKVWTVVPTVDCTGGDCGDSTWAQIAGVDMTLKRYTCFEDAEFSHGCRSVYGSPSVRVNTTELEAWAGDPGNLIVDVYQESTDTHTFAAADESVFTGLPSPDRQIRIPYSAPAGSVVVIDASAGTYTSNAELCSSEANNFRCAGQARSAARISFVPDVTTGVLAPLAGFNAPAGDTTPPTITATPSGPAGNGGWYRGNVNVSLVAADEGGSGVESMSFTVDGSAPGIVDGDTADVPVTGDGVHTMTYSAIDAEGNESESGSATVKIDATPPTISIAPQEGTEFINGAAVPTDLDCNDATSGVATCEGPATLDTTTPGNHVATFTATDVAGNSTTHTLSYSVVAAPGADHLSVSIPQLGFMLDGSVTSGGFTIARNASGQPVGVAGTATLPGPSGGTTTVGILVVRVAGVWIGGITISDPATSLNTRVATLSRTSVQATGPDAVTGTFTNPRTGLTVTWTVIDRV